MGWLQNLGWNLFGIGDNPIGNTVQDFAYQKGFDPWDSLTDETKLGLINQYNQTLGNQAAQRQLAWAPVGFGLKGLSLGFDIFGQNRNYNLTKKMLDRQWEGYQKQFNNNVNLIERQIKDQEDTRKQFDPNYQPNYVHLARV